MVKLKQLKELAWENAQLRIPYLIIRLSLTSIGKVLVGYRKGTRKLTSFVLAHVLVMVRVFKGRLFCFFLSFLYVTVFFLTIDSFITQYVCYISYRSCISLCFLFLSEIKLRRKEKSRKICKLNCDLNEFNKTIKTNFTE